MLMWQGMLAVEDQNLRAAVDIIEQMLKLARVSMRAHRLMGLYPARTSFTQAARLTAFATDRLAWLASQVASCPISREMAERRVPALAETEAQS